MPATTLLPLPAPRLPLLVRAVAAALLAGVALLVTAADVQFLGIGSAFWGFLVGVGVHLLISRRRGV